ncbi:MAG: D-aminoacyl-tRNA deacylase [Coriobacteriales bacterium]
MRAVIQRVSSARVDIEGQTVGSIGQGLLVLLGVGQGDGPEQLERLWSKIYKLRIFADEQGKTNLSLADVGGELLVVSQFTLFANCRKGNRPSFTQAGSPQLAEELYERFVERARQDVACVQTGRFGADMQVSLVNDGPFTILLDTDELM